MKKQILALVILLQTIILCIVPCYIGYRNEIKTDVAAQTESTHIERNLYENTIKDINMNTIKEQSSKSQIWFVGYTTANVNVRKEPSLDADIWEVYDFNTCVFCEQYNEAWVLVLLYMCEYEMVPAYISSKYIATTPCLSVEYDIPNNNGFKSYMPYDAITSKSSKQYILQKDYAYTGKYGIRQINGRYCVAIGTSFKVEVGTYFDILLENGTIIPCIVGDIKADIDTEDNNIVTTSNGCVSEFIVDSNVLNSNAKVLGDISECNEEWRSRAVSIRVYNKNIFND